MVVTQLWAFCLCYMVTITVSCCHYGNQDKVRRKGLSTDGHHPYRRTRYKCEACGRSFQLAYTYKAHKPGIKEKVIDMALNGSGIRDTARVLKINMNTVMSTLKKSEPNPICKPGLRAYQANGVHSLRS